jgi:hypothetical protein
MAFECCARDVLILHGGTAYDRRGACGDLQTALVVTIILIP